MNISVQRARALIDAGREDTVVKFVLASNPNTVEAKMFMLNITPFHHVRDTNLLKRIREFAWKVRPPGWDELEIAMKRNDAQWVVDIMETGNITKNEYSMILVDAVVAKSFDVADALIPYLKTYYEPPTLHDNRPMVFFFLFRIHPETCEKYINAGLGPSEGDVVSFAYEGDLEGIKCCWERFHVMSDEAMVHATDGNKPEVVEYLMKEGFDERKAVFHGLQKVIDVPEDVMKVFAKLGARCPRDSLPRLRHGRRWLMDNKKRTDIARRERSQPVGKKRKRDMDAEHEAHAIAADLIKMFENNEPDDLLVNQMLGGRRAYGPHFDKWLSTESFAKECEKYGRMNNALRAFAERIGSN